jgi:hypothetical protein
MVVICIVLTQVKHGRQGYTYTLSVFGVALGEQCLKKEEIREVSVNYIPR